MRQTLILAKALTNYHLTFPSSIKVWLLLCKYVKPCIIQIFRSTIGQFKFRRIKYFINIIIQHFYALNVKYILLLHKLCITLFTVIQDIITQQMLKHLMNVQVMKCITCRSKHILMHAHFFVIRIQIVW